MELLQVAQAAQAGSLTLLGTALALGFRHGIDWDHIAAITDITSSQDDRRLSILYGTIYFVLAFRFVYNASIVRSVIGSVVVVGTYLIAVTVAMLAIVVSLHRLANRLFGCSIAAGCPQPARLGEQLSGRVRQEEQVGPNQSLVLLGERLRGERIFQVEHHLQLRQIRDEPRLAAEMAEERRPVHLELRTRLLQPALQLVFRLCRHGDVDAVHGDADGEDGEQRAGEEDPIGERGKDAHRRPSEKFTSTSPPGSGTTTRRDSSGADSFHATTV